MTLTEVRMYLIDYFHAPPSLFQSKSERKIFVTVASSNFNTKKTNVHNQDFGCTGSLALN